MCNIAGYAGTRPAAPILIEMMKREEGFDAGFYTGIATVHEGKIYYRKVIGDLDRLLSKTDAAELPGTVGIIHSRTKSGGPVEWGHPFVSAGKCGKEPRIAYVANGNSGIFAPRDPEYNKMAEALLAEGYKMDSEIEIEDGIYNRLSNGKMVHMSDVMCTLIAKGEDLGKTPSEAMADAFCEMPGDIVGLCLSLSAPDSVIYSKISRPMCVSFAEHGAYIATTSIAHLDDALTDPVSLPFLSSGRVTKDGFTADRYKNPPAPVITADALLSAEICEIVQRELKEEKTFNEVLRKVKPIYPTRELAVLAATAATYTAFESLYKRGMLSITRHTVPGVAEDLTAPLFKFKLKN